MMTTTTTKRQARASRKLLRECVKDACTTGDVEAYLGVYADSLTDAGDDDGAEKIRFAAKLTRVLWHALEYNRTDPGWIGSMHRAGQRMYSPSRWRTYAYIYAPGYYGPDQYSSAQRIAQTLPGAVGAQVCYRPATAGVLLFAKFEAADKAIFLADAGELILSRAKLDGRGLEPGRLYTLDRVLKAVEDHVKAGGPIR